MGLLVSRTKMVSLSDGAGCMGMAPGGGAGCMGMTPGLHKAYLPSVGLLKLRGQKTREGQTEKAGMISTRAALGYHREDCTWLLGQGQMSRCQSEIKGTWKGWQTALERRQSTTSYFIAW